MEQLTRTRIISGDESIAAYSRNGLIIGAAPIEEYVILRKTGITDNKPFSFSYDPADFRIVSMQANSISSNYNIKFFNEHDVQVFDNNYQAQILDPNYLILQQRFKCTITPISDLSFLTIIGVQCSVISIVPLD